MRRWLVRALLMVLSVAGFFAGLFFLAHLAKEGVRDQERYQVGVLDIDCPTPADLDRVEFLTQVQYYANQRAKKLPDKFSILEEGLEDKLKQAFADHPWVEKVDRVALQQPREVRVGLTFRRPVLAVKWADQLRAVDAQGILLPKKAATADLPVFQGQAKTPQGGEGAAWGDPRVEQRARELGQKKSLSPE